MDSKLPSSSDFKKALIKMMRVHRNIQIATTLERANIELIPTEQRVDINDNSKALILRIIAPIDDFDIYTKDTREIIDGNAQMFFPSEWVTMVEVI